MKEQIDKYDNSFNFIRLLAAFQVFCGHAFAHLNVAMPIELQFVMRIFPGVPIFFGLSGYLLWNSLDKSSDFKQFALKRVLRLYPEMWGGELLNMIIILLLYRESIDWIQFVFFQIAQATLLQFWTPDCLREYGCGTPNGSLWTVTVMVQCYVLLWGSYKILHNRRLNLNYSRYLFQQCSMPYKHCVLTILLFHLISETISIQKRASSLL